MRILVAADNVDSADCLARLLKIAGHELRVAYDGPTALALATNFQPKVILLDIGLPGLSGYEVAERLRQFGDEECHLSGYYRMGTTRGSGKVKRSWV